MKTNLYFYSQLNYLPRTAIEAEILFAVCLSKKKALTGGKFLAREDKYSKKIGVKSAVLTLVYFYIIMIVHKCQQSAKRKLLLNKNNLSDVFQLTVGSGKTMAFENRRGKYKEIGKKVPQAYRVYVEHLFLRSDAGDARIFSKEGNMTNKLSSTNIPGSQGNSYPKAELDYNLDYEYDPAYAHRLIHAGTRYYRYDANGNITAEKDGPFTDEEEFVFTYSYDPETDVYGTDYGFGLDAPKDTWNERNLLTKSSDRNYTVHYRYGEDGQRALKYTDEGRSETLYFNNFFTIHIPTQDQNNPQGLRVHKHIFVGNSRLVTAMTHTDNSGDNEEQKAKRYYYHSDHLGSAQFVTDWKGRQYEHIEYTPYGELWIEEVAAGLDKLPFRFTGKELDEETGLYYYGARYLDPKYSRWLSGDPALGDYIPKAPVDDEAKKHNENLSGMGGVYNTVNLHVYHYAGNNPVKYTDPDGRLLINNVSENSASAREYERNHNLRYIAFLIKTLDAKGNAQIPIGNIDIILEKGLNKSLTLANAVKNNPNYVVDVKAIASETKNGNYQIDIDVLVFHYGADGKLVCDVNNSGTIAFADSSELGVFGPNSSIDQKLVNQKANEVINTVLHISNANLVGDK